MIYLVIVTLAILFSVIFLLRKKPLILVSIGFFILAIISLFVFFNRHLKIPQDYRQAINLLHMPDDLYNPIISEKIDFHVKGYTKKYKFEPKYLGIYEAGIDFGDGGVKKEYVFKGEILFEFISNGEVLESKIASKIISALYMDNNLERYRKVTIAEFNGYIGQNQIDDLSVRLTVIKPDMELQNYQGEVKVYIAIRGSK